MVKEWGRGCRSKTQFCPFTGRGARTENEIKNWATPVAEMRKHFPSTYPLGVLLGFSLPYQVGPGWPPPAQGSPIVRVEAGNWECGTHRPPGARAVLSGSKLSRRPPAKRGISLVLRQQNRDEIPAGDGRGGGAIAEPQ